MYNFVFCLLIQRLCDDIVKSAENNAMNHPMKINVRSSNYATIGSNY